MVRERKLAGRPIVLTSRRVHWGLTPLALGLGGGLLGWFDTWL